MIDEITIIWPAGGSTEVVKNVKPNQFIAMKEGVNGFTTLDIKELTFKKADGTIPMCAPRVIVQ